MDIGSWYNREHDCHVYVCIMWMIMHVTCMCRRMHAMHVRRCMWVYLIYMDVVYAHAYVYVCV